MPLPFSMAASSETPTADLCDLYISEPTRLQVCEPCLFHDYGGIKSFHGQIRTVRCFESNPLVKEILSEPGEGRVLVIDGGGSKRCALLGDQLANLGQKNGWAGIIVNGCIRDSKAIAQINIGVKALGTHPLKSVKDFRGDRRCKVAFAGVEFVPGHHLYADEDGILVSENELPKLHTNGDKHAISDLY